MQKTVAGKKQKVRAAYRMDTETFELHMTHRHRDSLAGLARLHAMTFEMEELYRAFHRRLHDTLLLEHEHGAESISDNARRAIECLQERQLRGWFEISGCSGRFVSVFPDGQIAVRIEGHITHYRSVEEAVGCLTRSLPRPE